jgi:glucokinase
MATIGIDIGGTKTAAAVVGPDGDLLSDIITTPTPAAAGPDAILRAAIEVALLARERGGVDIEAVGVGAAGVIDSHGVVASATDLLSGWTGTPVAGRLAEALQLPVVAINDVHAAAMGEASFGAAKGRERVLVVAVGTGIGGGFVRHGVLELGQGAIAGSIGHIPISRGALRRCSCGVLGHVEAYACGPAIERTYCELTGVRIGLREIARLQQQGDPTASAAITAGAEALGEAIAAAANLLDPDCIVIAGGVSELGPSLLDPVRDRYRSGVLPTARDVPVLPAALGLGATIVGAAVAALRR